ncbi:serine threonine- phosphatase 6 regulatory ankyrin repeat subunit B-like, partial, partial [Paramuricea clavata]
HDGILQLLLNHGASVNAVNEEGYTPLHGAASRGHDGILQLLLNHGASVNAVNEEGYTPLHDAASRGHDGHDGHDDGGTIAANSNGLLPQICELVSHLGVVEKWCKHQRVGRIRNCRVFKKCRGGSTSGSATLLSQHYHYLATDYRSTRSSQLINRDHSQLRVENLIYMFSNLGIIAIFSITIIVSKKMLCLRCVPTAFVPVETQSVPLRVCPHDLFNAFFLYRKKLYIRMRNCTYGCQLQNKDEKHNRVLFNTSITHYSSESIPSPHVLVNYTCHHIAKNRFSKELKMRANDMTVDTKVKRQVQDTYPTSCKMVKESGLSNGDARVDTNYALNNRLPNGEYHSKHAKTAYDKIHRRNIHRTRLACTNHECGSKEMVSSLWWLLWRLDSTTSKIQ